MVGGQEGYWLSVDYVLAHGQPWLSHRAHCTPTKKMRGRESERERERGLAPRNTILQQPITTDYSRFRNRQKPVSRNSQKGKDRRVKVWAPGVPFQRLMEWHQKLICNSDDIKCKK